MAPSTDRSARIAAAVERSKTEYQPQHAYTERDEAYRAWDGDSGGKYGLEYLAAWAYGQDLAAPSTGAEPGIDEEGRVLDLIWARIDKKKPLGGVSREVMDSTVRMAVKRGDARAGELADLGKSCWKSPHVGIALNAAEAYVMLGRYTDAVDPLMQASHAGLHYPILASLSLVLDKLISERSAQDAAGSDTVRNDTAIAQLESFRALVNAQRDRLTWKYDLFSSSEQEHRQASMTSDVDPRGESTLSKLPDAQIGAGSTSEDCAPADAAAPSAFSIPIPPQEENSNGQVTADGADIDIVSLAQVLNVSEGTLRTAMARLRKNATGAANGDEGKERAERGVREL